MGQKNSRRVRRQVVGPIIESLSQSESDSDASNQLATFKVIYGHHGEEEEHYEFPLEDRKKLAKEIAKEIPYVLFKFDNDYMLHSWGLSEPDEYYADFNYNPQNHRLTVGGQTYFKINSYEHIKAKVKYQILLIKRIFEFHCITCIGQMEEKIQEISDEAKTQVKSINNKLQAIYTLLDSLPGSPSYLEARSRFEAQAAPKRRNSWNGTVTAAKKEEEN